MIFIIGLFAASWALFGIVPAFVILALYVVADIAFTERQKREAWRQA